MLSRHSFGWFVACALACVACAGGGASDRDSDDGDEGGASGTEESGGRAGSDDDAQGGDGGSSDQGGAGGVGDQGGAGGVADNGGSGGAGGNGGNGGNGGTMNANCDVPALDGPGVFFSGQTREITKLVAGDANPGYVRGTASDTSYPPELVEVDDPALPCNTKYAYTIDVPTAAFENVFFAWNFRENEAEDLFRWYDASEWAGIEFWAKVGVPAAAWNVTIVDSTNLPANPAEMTDTRGLCPAATRAECEPVHGVTHITRSEWRRFTIGFDEFAAEGAMNGVDVTTLGRVDMIFQPFDESGMKIWVTGIRLITDEEL